MVIKTDKSMAHNKLKPCCTPERIHRVKVPGPIKAAVTNAAGPKENVKRIGLIFVKVQK